MLTLYHTREKNRITSAMKRHHFHIIFALIFITGWAFPECYFYDSSYSAGAHMVPIGIGWDEATCILQGNIWISDDTNGCDALMSTTISSGAITNPGTGDVIVAGTNNTLLSGCYTIQYSCCSTC